MATVHGSITRFQKRARIHKERERERPIRKRKERIQGSFSRFSGYPGSRRGPNPTTFYSKRTVSSSHDSRGVTNPRFCAKIGVEDKEGRASWSAETRCETPFKNSRNARAHPHTQTGDRRNLHKWRVQFRTRGSNTKDLSAGQPNSFGIWPLKRSAIQNFNPLTRNGRTSASDFSTAAAIYRRNF